MTNEYNGYIIKSSEQGSLSAITQPKGGSLPGALTGLWTSPSTARKAIDGYVAEQARIKAEKKPAKVTLTPRIAKAE